MDLQSPHLLFKKTKNNWQFGSSVESVWLLSPRQARLVNLFPVSALYFVTHSFLPLAFFFLLCSPVFSLFFFLCSSSSPFMPHLPLTFFLGFICVEGTETDCSNFWLAIRSQNWQRISLIERCTGAMARERLFTGFQEVAMTQSDFFKFLQEKRCDSLIRGYLGL